MAEQAYALTTVARLKTRLGITTSSFDTQMASIIAGATDFIENACGRRFLRTTYTQELYDGSNPDGTSRKLLILRNAPVISISSFQYRTGAKSNPSWVDFQADTYQEQLGTGIVRTALPAGYQNIRITYVAGYLMSWSDTYTIASHTLPHDISDLAERLSIKTFKRREAEGKSSESFAGSAITWGDYLEAHDKEVIANYSRTEFV